LANLIYTVFWILPLPTEWLFLEDIHTPEDINKLQKDDLYLLLDYSKQYLTNNDYNYTESRVLEYDKNNLPLDDLTITHLYSTSTSLYTHYSLHSS
jgi:hypothetical protein